MKFLSFHSVKRFFEMDLHEWLLSNLKGHLKLGRTNVESGILFAFVGGNCGGIEMNIFSSRQGWEWISLFQL